VTAPSAEIDAAIRACALEVQKGDPDRFLAAMTARPADRAPLFVLYAFNLELARIAWTTKEPLIAEMRLQFWADTLQSVAQNKPVQGHAVATALANLIREKDLPVPILAEMVAARRFDIYKDPHPSDAAQTRYIDHTAGHLMWLACHALGASDHDAPAIRNVGRAAGLAALLRALPALTASGRQPLRDPSGETLKHLAARGLNHWRGAKGHPMPQRIIPALRTAWLTPWTLKAVASDPAAASLGRLIPSEFYRRSLMIAKTVAGGW